MDALGNSIRLILTDEQVAVVTKNEALVIGIRATTMAAAKSYNSKKLA